MNDPPTALTLFIKLERVITVSAGRNSGTTHTPDGDFI